MSNRKIDIMKITPKLNTLMREHKEDIFLRNQMIDLLAEALELAKTSIPKYLPGLIKFGILKKEKVGTSSLFSFIQRDQYNKERVANALSNVREGGKKKKEEDLTEEIAIEFLKKRNYLVMKPSKLSIDKLREKFGDQINDCFDYEVI